jgi:hypothetical protein
LVATVAADATRWAFGAKRLTTRSRLILSYFLFNIGKSHVYRVLD